jgi:transposase-like protein
MNLPEDRVREEIRDAIKIDGEADELCKAKRFERSADRVDARAGSYRRKLVTQAGEVELKVPRLRSLPFETGKATSFL